MKRTDFYYDLPEELIAQEPLKDRSSSRLMILDKNTGEIEHKHFYDIVDELNEGDALILNDTKVLPARLYGQKEGTGGAIEFLLLHKHTLDTWEVILKPGRKAKPGARFVFGNGELKAEVLDVINDGNRLVKFEYEGVFEEVLDKIGEMPLPHYITHKLEDKNRYQTVYAKKPGSAAAPTAGLHFTPELLIIGSAYRYPVSNVITADNRTTGMHSRTTHIAFQHLGIFQRIAHQRIGRSFCCLQFRNIINGIP